VSDHVAVRPTASVRRGMRALMATGHYEETEDAFEWLTLEAADVVDAIAANDSHAGQVAAVIAVLTGTGFHDVACPGEAACLRRDAESIVSAVTCQGR
jgi:hypothetical protein